ncbi:probable cytosolic iron-sulfur protein assembly protein Ciao1 isoform X2 [Asterias rubens]|uniref:probable cytosolic iron-sulfur protein assembly protein Ciao1 isoform X2 n=1 Tax=Asterias rubens TaxID=7604 RepID=UPI00145540B7|nr:probable cytosolic iron-sulfur protein assembly protein Ciao1 isoform X2 [Asterias rubens]
MTKNGRTEATTVSAGDSFVSDFQWKCVCTLSGYHTRTIYDVDWCKQSGMLATCSGDESIHIFQEGNNEEFISTCCTNCAHAGDVNAVRWNPDGSNTLASAGDDNVVKLWKYIPN